MDLFLTINLCIIASLLPFLKFNTSLNYIDSFFCFGKAFFVEGFMGAIYPEFFHVENVEL